MSKKTEKTEEVKVTKTKVKKEKPKVELATISKSKVKLDKIEVFLIRDYELAKLFLNHESEFNLAQLSMLCGWADKNYEICFGCKKPTSEIYKIKDESSIINYLIKKGDLEEGHYFIKCD